MEQISWASKHGPEDLESNLSLDFMAVDKMCCLMAEIQDPELLKRLFPLVQGLSIAKFHENKFTF